MYNEQCVWLVLVLWEYQYLGNFKSSNWNVPEDNNKLTSLSTADNPVEI